MHQGKGAAAYGAHGAGAVGLKYLGNHADGIREFLSGRNNRHQRTLCQGTMTDFPASRAAYRTRLAYGVAREVVLMNVVLAGLNPQAVQHLFITQGTQSGDGQNLGLATGKQAGTVSPRQQAHLAADRSYFLHLTAVRTDFLLGNHAADDFLDNLVQHIRNFLDCIRINLQEMLQCLCLDSGNMLVTSQLIRISHCLIQLGSSILADSLLHVLRHSKQLDLALFLTYSLLHLILESNDFLNFLMAKENCLKDNLLRQLIGTSLNHHYRITGPGNSQVQVGSLTLLHSRVDDKLTINTAYPDTSYRAKERNIRNSQGTGSTNHSSNLRCIVVLYGKDGSHNLHIVSIALREQRTDRTVNQAAAQNSRLARTSLSLYKTARNLADSVHLLLIVNGQREEVNALARLLRSGSSNQNNGLTITNQSSTICLLCHLAGLNGKRPAAKLHFKTFHQVFPPVFSIVFCIPCDYITKIEKIIIFSGKSLPAAM